jgi:hypothetical protein
MELVKQVCSPELAKRLNQVAFHGLTVDCSSSPPTESDNISAIAVAACQAREVNMSLGREWLECMWTEQAQSTAERNLMDVQAHYPKFHNAVGAAIVSI